MRLSIIFLRFMATDRKLSLHWQTTSTRAWQPGKQRRAAARIPFSRLLFVCTHQHGKLNGRAVREGRKPLPVPLFRSANPYVSAHPFLAGGARTPHHNNGVNHDW